MIKKSFGIVKGFCEGGEAGLLKESPVLLIMETIRGVWRKGEQI
jgi:hypothetical protein